MTRPPFLGRASYRRRRLIDAARLLPALGLFLFLLPALWRPAEAPPPETLRAGEFLFLAWSLLIIAAFLLSRRLMRGAPGEGAREGGEDRGGGAAGPRDGDGPV